MDLSLVSRLGGHSEPRTHRGKEKFPGISFHSYSPTGMTITYALMEKLEDLSKSTPDRVVIKKKSQVTRLIKDGETVIGVEFTTGGKTFTEHGPVIIATGGYAADFSSSSLLQKHRPELVKLPTTNGDHCTGGKFVYSVVFTTVFLLRRNQDDYRCWRKHYSHGQGSGSPNWTGRSQGTRCKGQVSGGRGFAWSRFVYLSLLLIFLR